MQLLWLEVRWAGMEEGQGVRSGAVRSLSLSLLHSCHSKPPGDGFSSFSGFANRREGPQITIQAYSPPPYWTSHFHMVNGWLIVITDSLNLHWNSICAPRAGNFGGGENIPAFLPANFHQLPRLSQSISSLLMEFSQNHHMQGTPCLPTHAKVFCKSLYYKDYFTPFFF